jgi:hypothetical protein
MNSIPILIFWVLAIWGAASRRPVLIYLFFATMPFGAFAAIPTALTGGLTLTATPIVTLLIVLRTFLNRQGPATFLTLAILPQRLMLLFLFWIVAAIVTAFMPRLFENAVMVVPIRGDLSATAPLRPTMQNLSQFAYLTIAVLSVFAFAQILQSPTARQTALKAMCLGGAITAATGLLDYASQFVPLDAILTPFRTATYALAIDVEVLGAKRVVGLMPEASAFGGLCLALMGALYFYRRAIADDTVRNLWAPAVLGALALCAWLSTSSGTYVGMFLLAVVAALEWLLRANSKSHPHSLYRRGLLGELSLVTAVTCGLAALLIAWPHAFDPIYSLIDRMVLQKTSSSSFAERGMWRSIAGSSLLDTYGFGVGLGGTRASSSLVAIFSGTGILGGMLYYAFVLQSLLRPTANAPVEDQLTVAAFRFSFIPTFIVTLMVGDSDFGGVIAFGFGITTALAIVQTKRATGHVRLHVPAPEGPPQAEALARTA